MDVTAEIEADILKRIVALLFSLSRLAERAASRSYPVRYLVLWILRPAEMVAYDYLGDAIAEPFAVRNSRAHAQHVAAIFSSAALALDHEPRLERRFTRRGTRRGPSAATVGSAEPDACSRRLRQARAKLLTRRALFFAPAPRLDTS